MTITVGTDTYVTIAEADAYLALYYVSTDARLVAWLALSDADKEIYLRNATKSLERIRFPGRKLADSQALSFPRLIALVKPYRREPDYSQSSYSGNLSGSDCGDENLYSGSQSVPDEIKYAEIEEAFELSSPSSDTDHFNAVNGSLESYRVGQVAEKIRAPLSGANRSNGTELYLRSKAAQNYASGFAGGAFSTR